MFFVVEVDGDEDIIIAWIVCEEIDELRAFVCDDEEEGDESGACSCCEEGGGGCCSLLLLLVDVGVDIS